MNIYDAAGLKTYYDQDPIETQIKENPIIQKAIDHGHFLGTYSIMSTCVYEENSFRYFCNMYDKKLLSFQFHLITDSIWRNCNLVRYLPTGDPFYNNFVVVKRNPKERSAVVNIIDSAVLPSTESYAQADLQVVGYPQRIRFFANEATSTDEEMALIVSFDSGDGRFNHNQEAPLGCPISYGLTYQETESSAHKKALENLFKRVPNFDDNALFAKVIRIEKPRFKKESNCVIVYLDTIFGSLGIFVNIDDLEEESKRNLKVGSYYYGCLQIRASASIGDRANGISMDPSDTLLAFKTYLKSGMPDSIYNIGQFMLDDVRYCSTTLPEPIEGYEDTANYLMRVISSRRPRRLWVREATVTKADPSCPYPHKVGESCLAVRFNPSQIDQLIFLSFNEHNFISQIDVIDYKYFEVETTPPNAW